MYNKIIIFCCLIFLPHTAKSQPIPIEILVGNKYLQTNIVVIKQFSEQSKFGFLNVSGIDAYYSDKHFNGSVMITEVDYKLIKKIGFGVGMTYNSISGLAPSIGMSYNNFGPRHGITLAPAVLFSSNNSARLIVNLAIRPKLSDQLNLYMSMNNLFIYGFNGDHIRGFQKLRVGIDYKSFQFGFGVNFDQYGPMRNSRINLGGFIRKEFH